MLSKVKKLGRGIVEVPILRARAMGMGFIESRIAESIGSPAIAKLITSAFGLKSIDKKATQAAKKRLKKEYGVDPKLESMFGRGGFGGGDEGVSSKTISKKLNEIKKTLQGMVKTIVSISKKVDAIGEQNDQILKAAQARLTQEIGQIMQSAPPMMVPEGIPVGTEKSEGGIIVPQQKEKLVERTLTEKTVENNERTLTEKTVENNVMPEKPEKEKSVVPEPTVTPKKQATKVEMIREKVMESLTKRYPILKILNVKSPSETTPKDRPYVESKSEENKLTESKTGVMSDKSGLQPALESIAQKTPLQTTIEPDELETLLKDALKNALEELKNENPDLFKSEDGGLLSKLPLPGGLGKKLGRGAAAGGAKTAGKTGGKIAGKTVLKSALKKIPIVGAIAGLGFAASRALSGDWTGAAMEAGSGLASTVPGLGTAASVGLDAALAARDMGVMGGGSPMPPKPEEPQLSTANPTNSGSEIIEMNRRIQSGEVATRTTPQGTPIVQRITNNNVLPPTEKKSTIDVGNKENTFNRLIAQDFEHPSTYSSYNMG